MSVEGVLAGVAAFGSAAVLSLSFAWLAERFALVDDGADARERKLQRRAVPLVGGLAIACVVLLVWARMPEVPPWGSTGPRFLLPAELELVRAGYGALALLGALLLGLVDDLATRGLRPGLKLAGQCAVAVLCARHALESNVDGAWGAAALAFALALLAMNAFNTFDNADGAATSLGALGLCAVAPALAAPLLGFLPFNLWVRRKAPDGSTVPLAYLGDAGSQFLGVLVALVPGAWPALALPLLDLARLAVVRWRRGSRPWIGDRRHLAHRLQARGLGPTAVVLVLLVLAAPSVLLPIPAGGAPLAVAGGLLGTLLLFVLAVRATPDVP